MQTCRLAACFTCSTTERFPRRSNPAARIGTALHAVLQSIGARAASHQNPLEFVSETLALFRSELDVQRLSAAGQVRERGVEWPQNRIKAAELALIRIARSVAQRPHNAATPHAIGRRSTEITLHSRNGMLKGTADYIEKSGSEVTIVDFKTSLGLEDLEAHIDQVHFYAWLYHDAYGAWPAQGRLEYLLIPERRTFPVDIGRATKLAAVAEAFALTMPFGDCLDSLASPGDHCKWCDYRAWCQPFWTHETALDVYCAVALRGLQGTVLHKALDADAFLINMDCGQSTFDVRGRLNTHPHAELISVGDRVRLLDFQLISHGARGSLLLTSASEIFRISESG